MLHLRLHVHALAAAAAASRALASRAGARPRLARKPVSRAAKRRALAKLVAADPAAITPAALSRLHAPPALRAKVRQARRERPLFGGADAPAPPPPAAAAAAASRNAPSSSSPRRTFADLGLHPGLVAGVAEMGIAAPTDIQTSALPHLLDGKSALVAALTGSGKTLAVLLPLLHALKAAEDPAATAPPGRPRGLIIVPSRELAHQTLGVVKALSHSCRLSSMALTGGVTPSKQRAAIRGMKRPLDVLVATPGRLADSLASGAVALSRADTLIEGFDLADILRPLHLRATTSARETLPPPQVVLATAGVSPPLASGINSFLARYKLTTIAGPGLHSLPPGIDLEFLRPQAASRDKEALLVDVVTRTLASPHARAMVFCNTIGSARWAAHTLADAAIATASLHGGVKPNTRRAQYAAFLDGSAPVLVTTDVGSRGLDIPLLDAVVNADFPLTPLDFVHRAGRVGRMLSDVAKAALPSPAARSRRGRKQRSPGRVISLIGSAKDASMAQFIQRAAAAGEPLVDFPHSVGAPDSSASSALLRDLAARSAPRRR
ncbi:ATP-dependent RNA helicase [Thecamonas trahens ATCC 50062]|uniref:ATP-dependent RNA helicase n=1 Tax=Thecamonas trahens ATCC 50062 TaxID=461836 RepID=A0A0L0DD37_THETB|nr:ATP-dependent RNA helicase [Thecamonas trahens ATCC 50062]KNC50257.1 ATP-dependent RNA helicase [Thecamonas trahens ATCC 50062]|eukprot:XP_013757086.1 ATP-dependent RNA helicase [Thecamonas trahens ATCC 50062]